MNIKKTLTASGIKVTEFAKIVGVHRVTASTWVNGRFSPHPYIADGITAWVAKIDAATRAGLLPITFEPKERLASRVKKIKAVLSSVSKEKQ